MQLRRAVFIKQRHRCPILNRLLEVVDRNVIAENILCPFLTGNQWRAGEREKQRLGQRCAHIQREGVVLAAVRFVGKHDHI